MTATATQQVTQEEVQPNPYNANKTWDNSNPNAPRGAEGANDSLAYVTPQKTAVSTMQPSLDEAITTTDADKTSEATPSAKETQETESISADKYKKVDYKKRYDDLKKHYDTKLGEWRGKEAEMKADIIANRPKYQAPKTPEELATFREEYPDVYDVVETVAHMRSQEQISDLQEKVEILSHREQEVVRREAEQELLSIHPDFREIRDSEDFHEWAKVQPEAIQSWIYENTGDSTLASRAIDLYKKDAGITSSTNDAGISTEAVQVTEDPRGSAADSVKVTTKTDDPQSQEKIWTTSEIAQLSVNQYEKLQSELDRAFEEGRIVKG